MAHPTQRYTVTVETTTDPYDFKIALRQAWQRLPVAVGGEITHKGMGRAQYRVRLEAIEPLSAYNSLDLED